MPARWVIFFIAAFFASLALSLVSPTGNASAQELSFTITSLNAEDWPSVQVHGRIVDDTGQPVTGLTGADFTATVGDEAIAVIDAELAVDPAVGIATVLTFDTSERMEGEPLERAKDAGLALVEQLGPGDQVAVLAFSDDVVERQNFTSDKDLASEAINGLVAGGDSALYEAVDESVQAAVFGPLTYKAVVVLSDGVDTVGGIDPERTLFRAGESRAVFFVLGFGQVNESYLSRLAAAGHGEFLLTPSPGDLSTLYEDTATLLRQQYAITLDAQGLDPKAVNGLPLRIEASTGEDVLVAETTLAVPEEFLAPEATPQLPTVAPPVDVEPQPEPSAEDGESSDFPVVPLIAAAAVAAGGGAMALMVLRRRRRTEAVAVAHEHITDERFGLEPAEVDAPPADREADQWEYPTIERAASDTPLAWLVTDDARVPLGERPATVGFTEDCTVRLPNNGAFQIERARVWRRDGRYMLHNLSRMGGVTIAGRPVSWAVLENGDEILIGGVRLVFEENPPETTN